MKFSARVYVEKLRLNQRQAVHNIPCPFHPDNKPSMSINLMKAVHYCHGACSEPRGGGPLQFIMKWARYVEKKPIELHEARSRLRSSFRLISAQAFLRDQMTKEVELFVSFSAPRFATWSKLVERAIGDINAYCADHPDDVDDEIWDMLARLHRELAWSDRAFALCTARQTTPEIVPIYAECQRRDWWNPNIALDVEEARQHERALARRMEAACRVNPSPSTTRQPIPRRTPVR
jgi:hypothetical protein